MKNNISHEPDGTNVAAPVGVADQPTEKYQLIVFKLGSEEYGIHIDQIKEVVLTPRITRMPQMPDYIKGVANIRGSILAIVDLEEKFGLRQENTAAEAATAHYTLVAESQDLNIGVLVKEVPNTLSVLSSDVDETLNVVQGASEHDHYIRGIVKVDERLIILIDLFKIMQSHDLTGVL